MRLVDKLIIAAAFTACSPSIDGSVRVPTPPADVEHVGLITFDRFGNWVDATGLAPRDPVNVYPDTIALGEEGDQLRVVGFTAEQLATCHARPGQRIGQAKLEVAPNATIALPGPAWTVGGAWRDSTVDLEPSSFDDPISSPWIAADVNSCAAHRTTVTRVAHGYDKSRTLFMLPNADRSAKLFSTRGETFHIDVDTLVMTRVAETSTNTAVIGGFVDDTQRQWLFRRDGRLERVDVDGRVEVVSITGPWQTSYQVFADGEDVQGQIEIFALTSKGDVLYFRNATWSVIGKVDIRQGLTDIAAADVYWRGPGDALIVQENTQIVYYATPDRVRELLVSTIDEQGPISILDTERYGLVLGTRLGALYQSWDGEAWTLFHRTVANRAAYGLFEIAGGLFFGGNRGDFRFVYEELDPCPQTSYALDSIRAMAQFGNRIVMHAQLEAPGAAVIGVDFESVPVGCGP